MEIARHQAYRKKIHSSTNDAASTTGGCATCDPSARRHRPEQYRRLRVSIASGDFSSEFLCSTCCAYWCRTADLSQFHLTSTLSASDHVDRARSLCPAKTPDDLYPVPRPYKFDLEFHVRPPIGGSEVKENTKRTRKTRKTKKLKTKKTRKTKNIYFTRYLFY